jgi:hypothetical protein
MSLILFVSILLLIVSLVFIAMGLVNDDDDIFGFGAVIGILSIIFGFIIMCNGVQVGEKHEKITAFTIGEMGLIVDHPISKVERLTDYRLIDDMKSGEYDLFVGYSLNSYNSPIPSQYFFFVQKKTEAEKPIVNQVITYKVTSYKVTSK